MRSFFIKVLLLVTTVLRCADACPTYQPPTFDGRVLPIAFRNDGSAPVKVSLWHPQAPAVPFNTTTVSPGQNVYLLPTSSGVGEDWGISVGPSCVLPVAAVAIDYPGANWQATGNANGGFTVPVSQTLTLSAPVNLGSGTTTLNGGDTATSTIPFAFDWGDGTFSVGFFPQTKAYSSGGTFRITVYAQYGAKNGFATTNVTIPNQDYYFSHFVFAENWESTLTYNNYSQQSVTCTTNFYGDNGAPLGVPFAQGTVTTRTDVLASGGSIHDPTTAPHTGTVVEGWAQATCTGPVQASILFRQFNAGVPIAEAGVNAEAAPTTEFATFAQTATGVAYANPSTTQSATITFTVYNNAGVRLGSQSITLGPLAHGASNIGPLLGLQSFTGFVKITSTIPIISLSLNFEAAPIFSSLPPGDLPSTTQLVTP